MGAPSYKYLQALSERSELPGSRPLIKSTTQEILSGKRVRLPDWQWVSAFVRACHAAAAESGLPTDGLGTVQEWC
ncbi:hypothetical protein C1I98_23435, partial [Spongiactinospora gelatinilytica]